MTKAILGPILFLCSLSSAFAQQEHQPAQSNEKNASIQSETIRNKSIYIYSFLDLRQAEYTRKVLDAINAGLEQRLKELNANGPILEYRNTPQGEFLADSMAEGSSATAVPVRTVINENARAELAAGTKLRLVIFPTRYDLAGAWRYYSIRWVLFEAGNMHPIWDYIYSGRHLVMWSNKENSDARAKKILDAAFENLKSKGLI